MTSRRKALSNEVQELREQVSVLTEHVIELRRRFNKLPERVAHAVHPVIELSKLSEDPTRQVRFSGTALPAASALKLVLAISRFRPNQVVEFGSGESTAWIAQALQHNGSGILTSLEHHPTFFGMTRDNLDASGAGDYADLRLAELAALPSSEQWAEGTLWYDSEKIQDLHDVELLMIDGPPKRDQDDARYPAVPMMIDRLAPGAHVFVDDAHTADMKKVVQRWLEEFPLDVVDPEPEGERLLHLRLRDS